ncbi:MAG TPA: UDP-N-acetylglucosamine 1-carboxyvinyltransferase [Patescibacteria group bacterium]
MTTHTNQPYFTITGGTPLHGSVRVGGAKNASYKLMIAALLGDSESRLLNFSHISDVALVRDIINYLGGHAYEAGERAIFIDPTNLTSPRIKPEHGAQGRFSTMFIPALLHRFGRAEVPQPGGDKIGKRDLDRHFDGLKALGAEIRVENGIYIATTNGLKGATYRFKKNTHTGTETLIMAAVKAKGRTILENAAEEPEIDDLITFLNSMGAWIRRRPNRVIEIEGVDHLQGAIHRVMPDRNEVVTYACTAISTKGDIVVENARPEHLSAFLATFDQINAGYEMGNYGIRFFYKGPLQATTITTQIEPGFMTDWQPLIATVLTQCHGNSIIHETIMANRFQYVEALKQMGADIEFFNPEVTNPEEIYNFNTDEDKPEYFHAIKITGPSQLHAGEFQVVDLRHGATLVSAALAAQGTSKLFNIEQIDRGYEKLHERLSSMGANIVRNA